MQISKVFSTAVPPRGVFAGQNEGPEWWLRRQALAYILGLDPVIVLMTPEVTEEKMAELVGMCTESDDFTADTLNTIIEGLLEKSRN